MSVQLGSLTIASGTDTTFNGAPNTGVKAILIGNESGLTVTITMEGGSVQKTLYPSVIDWFQVNPGFNGNIKIHPITVLNNASTFPASTLIFDAIGLNDNEDSSQYPISLPRNTNIGNNLTVSSGSATSVTNDNQALTPSNVFVESTPTGVGSSTVSIATDGTVTIKGDVAGVLTTLIQTVIAAAAGASSVILGDAARTVEVLGKLLVDGTTTHTGASTFTGDATFNGAGTGVSVAHNLGVTGSSSLDNGALTTDGAGNVSAVNNVTMGSAKTLACDNIKDTAGSGTYLSVSGSGGTMVTRVQVDAGGSIAFQIGQGSNAATIDSTGFLNLVHSVNLPVGSLGQLATFSGGGSGTVATGVTNPTSIAFDDCTVSGSSQTIGGTVASSSVVTTGAGLAWRGTSWHN